MYLTILRESNKLQPHEQTKKRNRNGEEVNPRQLLKGRATNDPQPPPPCFCSLSRLPTTAAFEGGKWLTIQSDSFTYRGQARGAHGRGRLVG